MTVEETFYLVNKTQFVLQPHFGGSSFQAAERAPGFAIDWEVSPQMLVVSIFFAIIQSFLLIFHQFHVCFEFSCLVFDAISGQAQIADVTVCWRDA